MVYLKGLKSYQPSKFKRVDFLSFYLVKRTFRLHFYWQLLSPLRYTKVIYLFGKPRSVVIMPEKLKGGVACLYCARPLSKWQFCFINRQRYDIHCLKLYDTISITISIESQNVTDKSCLVCLRSEKYEFGVTFRSQRSMGRQPLGSNLKIHQIKKFAYKSC